MAGRGIWVRGIVMLYTSAELVIPIRRRPEEVGPLRGKGPGSGYEINCFKNYAESVIC